MQASIVLTVIGPDRPGLVELLSETLGRHQANWLESSMASLAGQFAGLVHASLPAHRVTALETELAGLQSRGLRVTLTQGSDSQAPGAPSTTLDLVGHDRPGIVREISRALAGLGVSIIELETAVEDASMAGGMLFRARARLALPADLTPEHLSGALEDLANELMVDVHIGEKTGPGST